MAVLGLGGAGGGAGRMLNARFIDARRIFGMLPPPSKTHHHQFSLGAVASFVNPNRNKESIQSSGWAQGKAARAQFSATRDPQRGHKQVRCADLPERWLTGQYHRVPGHGRVPVYRVIRLRWD